MKSECECNNMVWFLWCRGECGEIEEEVTRLGNDGGNWGRI